MAASSQQIQQELTAAKLSSLFARLSAAKDTPRRDVAKAYQQAQIWLVDTPGFSLLPDYLLLKQFYFLLAHYIKTSRSIFKFFHHVPFVTSMLNALPDVCAEFMSKNQPAAASSTASLSDNLQKKLMMYVLLQCIKRMVEFYSEENLQNMDAKGDFIAMLINAMEVCQVDDSIVELSRVVSEADNNKPMLLEIVANLCCYYDFFLSAKNKSALGRSIQFLTSALFDYQLSNGILTHINANIQKVFNSILYIRNNNTLQSKELLTLLCQQRLEKSTFSEEDRAKQIPLIVITMSEENALAKLDNILTKYKPREQGHILSLILSNYLVVQKDGVEKIESLGQDSFYHMLIIIIKAYVKKHMSIDIFKETFKHFINHPALFEAVLRLYFEQEECRQFYAEILLTSCYAIHAYCQNDDGLSITLEKTTCKALSSINSYQNAVFLKDESENEKFIALLWWAIYQNQTNVNMTNDVFLHKVVNIAIKNKSNDLLTQFMNSKFNMRIDLLKYPMNDIIYLLQCADSDATIFRVIHGQLLHEIVTICINNKHTDAFVKIITHATSTRGQFDKSFHGYIDSHIHDPLSKQLAITLYKKRSDRFNVECLLLLLQSESLLIFLIKLYAQDKGQKNFVTMLLALDLPLLNALSFALTAQQPVNESPATSAQPLSPEKQPTTNESPAASAQKMLENAFDTLYQLYQWRHANEDMVTLFNQMIRALWLRQEGSATMPAQDIDFSDEIYALATTAWEAVTTALAAHDAQRRVAMQRHRHDLSYPHDVMALHQDLNARAQVAEQSTAFGRKSNLWLVDTELHHARFFLSPVIIEREHGRIQRFQEHLDELLTEGYPIPHALLTFIHQHISSMPREALVKKIHDIAEVLIHFLNLPNDIFYEGNLTKLSCTIAEIISQRAWPLLDKLLDFLQRIGMTLNQINVLGFWQQLFGYNSVTPAMFIKLKQLAPQFSMNMPCFGSESVWHSLIAMGRSDICLALLALTDRPYIHHSYTLMKQAIWTNNTRLTIALLMSYQRSGDRYILGRPQGGRPVTGIDDNLLHDLILTAIERQQCTVVIALLQHYGVAHILYPMTLLNAAINQKNLEIVATLLTHTSLDIITRPKRVGPGEHILPAQKAIDAGNLDALKLLYQHFLQSQTHTVASTVSSDVTSAKLDSASVPTTSSYAASSSQSHMPIPLTEPLEIFIYQAYRREDSQSTLIHRAICQGHVKILRWFVDALGVQLEAMDVVDFAFQQLSNTKVSQSIFVIRKTLAYLLRHNQHFDIHLAIAAMRKVQAHDYLNDCVSRYKNYLNQLEIVHQWVDGVGHIPSFELVKRAMITLEKPRSVPLEAIEIAIAEKLVKRAILFAIELTVAEKHEQSTRQLLKYLVSPAYEALKAEVNEEIRLQKDKINRYLFPDFPRSFRHSIRQSIVAALRRPTTASVAVTNTTLSISEKIAKVINNLIDFAGLQEKPELDPKLTVRGYDGSAKPVIKLSRAAQLWLLQLVNDTSSSSDASIQADAEMNLMTDDALLSWVQGLAVHIAHYVHAFYAGHDEKTRDAAIDAVMKEQNIFSYLTHCSTSEDKSVPSPIYPASSSTDNCAPLPKHGEHLFEEDKLDIVGDICWAMFTRPKVIPVPGLEPRLQLSPLASSCA